MKDDCAESPLGDVSEGFFYFLAKSGMQYMNLIGCNSKRCFYKTSGCDIALGGYLHWCELPSAPQPETAGVGLVM
jgi:hypothetical protein